MVHTGATNYGVRYYSLRWHAADAAAGLHRLRWTPEWSPARICHCREPVCLAVSTPDDRLFTADVRAFTASAI